MVMDGLPQLHRLREHGVVRSFALARNRLRERVPCQPSDSEERSRPRAEEQLPSRASSGSARGKLSIAAPWLALVTRGHQGTALWFGTQLMRALLVGVCWCGASVAEEGQGATPPAAAVLILLHAVVVPR